MKVLGVRIVESPIGAIEIVGDEKGVRFVRLIDRPSRIAEPWFCAMVEQGVRQIQEYFEGRRTEFDSLRLAMIGSEFQVAVWEAAMRIPFGRTETYGSLAEKIGKPGAARAVGNALNANPLLLIVPCHRVIGSSASCGGFAAGMEKKEWLLAYEKKRSGGS